MSLPFSLLSASSVPTTTLHSGHNRRFPSPSCLFCLLTAPPSAQPFSTVHKFPTGSHGSLLLLQAWGLLNRTLTGPGVLPGCGPLAPWEPDPRAGLLLGTPRPHLLASAGTAQQSCSRSVTAWPPSPTAPVTLTQSCPQPRLSPWEGLRAWATVRTEGPTVCGECKRSQDRDREMVTPQGEGDSEAWRVLWQRAPGVGPWRGCVCSGELALP